MKNNENIDAFVKAAVTNYLQEARIKMGSTQKAAAAALGISEAKLRQIESGKNAPSIAMAYRMCDFYDVEWEALGDVILDVMFADDAAHISSTDAKKSSNMQAVREEAKTVKRKAKEVAVEIVVAKLIELGWHDVEVRDIFKRGNNFDLHASKSNSKVRIKVTGYQHATKATLCVTWYERGPTFNRNEDDDDADFLIAVRFTDEDDAECIIMTIDEAEDCVDWFAEEVKALGNKPVYLHAYIGPPRNSRFTFNTRKVWKPYLNKWMKLKV
jgi:DNA-binding XRE family transcriptional regulator